MKELIRHISIFGDLVSQIYWNLKTRKTRSRRFPGSNKYWERRYSTGGNSGAGSYGKFAEFKATVINEFVAKHNIRSIIEFGCGDGNQLSLAEYPTYLGFDVSETAILKCQKQFERDTSKSFRLMVDYKGEEADIVLSLDVIYHLIEDDVFEEHMKNLFQSAVRYVIIYSSDSEINRGYEGTHVRHRKFTRWIRKNVPHWKLVAHIPNSYPYHGDYTQGSFADFYIYTKTH